MAAERLSYRGGQGLGAQRQGLGGQGQGLGEEGVGGLEGGGNLIRHRLIVTSLHH